ncbi:hydantoinase/oxoprolinase family protein [Rhodoligotrophos ferricapiens]|uniref:hydantoinase/oxoprolinase family protein n=1 Tax=Rhodoligotrophos ferricapiens TaxID=3069264 RepID=UPI00315C8B39
MTKTFRIGIDVGGTFTDLVAIDDEGTTTFTKSPSTPEDQSIGVIAGLTDLAARLGLGLRDLLATTDRIVHGTTVATNALLERKGAKVGLLTTEGHRDVIEMREGLKEERYNLLLPPPDPLVPRHLRRGVRERIAYDGSVLTPLDEASLAREIARLKQEQVTSVAVCYFHSYRNPAHEQATLEHLAREMPEAYVSLSSDVLPQIKEYERVSTTVVNAYVGPAVRKYLTNLERRLAEQGFGGALFIILSHGGIAPVDEASRLAAGTVLSGPAGGIAGSRRCAELLNRGNLIPFDMGGTSTDISLIVDEEIALSSERGLAGQRIALRSLDIISIGAGGGSIARVDDGGTFHVGPESAGAVPGPACYGNGGTEPAVTDANLLLGYLDPDNFLGGRRKLDRTAAEAAVDRLADKLGLSRDETAAGIFRLINLKMADGIRLMTLRRGVDPRGFTLLSFGGAAGLHAVEVAREMEMSRVVVPTVASVLSAWGMLASDLRYEVTRSHIGDTAALDSAKLREIFAELEAEAKRRLGSWFKGPIHIERSAEMRYGEQIFEVDVSLDGLDLSDPGIMDAIIDRFHRRHEELYTYSSPGQEVVLVNARVAAVGEVPAAIDRQNVVAPASEPATPERTRRAFFGAWHEVPVYALDSLAPGHVITGPAIIEAETTTVVLNTEDKAEVNDLAWLDITLRPRTQ